MSSLSISLIVFLCVFGGALFGMFLRNVLPESHVSTESRSLINLGIGTIATMSALVLGLMVSTAKSSYDSQRNDLNVISAKLILLDRVLAHYGPETKELREYLRATVIKAMDRIWPKDRSRPPQLEPAGGLDILFDKVQDLTPKDDAQRSLQARALNMIMDLGQTRMLVVEEQASSFSRPLLVVVVFSVAICFMSFSLNARSNPTVIATYFLSALSIAGVVFMILEMYSPFHGLFQISNAPLQNTVMHLGR